MAAILETLTASPARPVEWDALMPEEGERIPWQVWVRAKGPGYWLFRYATRLARLLSALERRLGRGVPDIVCNPNGVEEAAAFWSEAEARDCCCLLYAHYGGRVAVTYGPVVVGRVHPLSSVPAVGDRRFNPFDFFDFSSTEEVKRRARHKLVTVEEWEEVRAAKAILSGALRREPRL